MFTQQKLLKAFINNYILNNTLQALRVLLSDTVIYWILQNKVIKPKHGLLLNIKK